VDDEVVIPGDRVRMLRRVRKVREFTEEPVAPELVDAIVDVGRWSGSSANNQPWRFIVIRDAATIGRLHEAGVPETRCLRTAQAAVAVAVPANPAQLIEDAYDDGRAAERMLIAANMLDLGAAVAWVLPELRDAVAEIIELPPSHFVRTILALGHPTDSALRPKSPPGQARLPRAETVFLERWPRG
jgi:nitroreductase